VDAAVVTVGFRSPAVWETAWKGGAAKVAIVVGWSNAEARSGKEDVAVFTAFERAFAFGCEWREWGAEVQAMFRG
jgi:hypothetical protein